MVKQALNLSPEARDYFERGRLALNRENTSSNISSGFLFFGIFSIISVITVLLKKRSKI